MQTNTRKKQRNSDSRMLKINAVSMGKDEWFVLYPEIRLSGEWLEKIGFEPGQKVNVRTAKNEVLITVAE